MRAPSVSTENLGGKIYRHAALDVQRGRRYNQRANQGGTMLGKEGSDEAVEILREVVSRPLGSAGRQSLVQQLAALIARDQTGDLAAAIDRAAAGRRLLRETDQP